MDSNRLSKAVAGLVELVARLRAPGGCPWDAKQTDTTIKIYLLEEAYEVLEAIERSSPSDVCQELGDLLFHILFLARLADERSEFDFVDVVEKITKKMIRRHPHVFGGKEVNSADDVARNWARIKKAEKGGSDDTTLFLNDVPGDLPALLRAHRLSERAAKVDFDWPNADEIWSKVLEELEELRSAVTRQQKDLFSEEMGDLLFSLVNLARHWGFNGEQLLRDANNKFIRRFENMERELKDRGITLEEASQDQMNRIWEQIKERE